jgi:hypothetical protein
VLDRKVLGAVLLDDLSAGHSTLEAVSDHEALGQVLRRQTKRAERRSDLIQASEHVILQAGTRVEDPNAQAVGKKQTGPRDPDRASRDHGDLIEAVAAPVVSSL